MLKLEDLKVGMQVEGLVSGEIVNIIQTLSAGNDGLTVVYKLTSGKYDSQVIYRDKENSLSLAEKGLAWSFDSPGPEFKLALEAYRIRQGHLFDPMMAVHSSEVEPLPHQISAVYESMLTKHPLRYVLADDPGAGKTIMAGLLIKEMIIRGDAKRVLIVAPGSLTEQWQTEMGQKFHLDFDLVTNEAQRVCRSGNIFAEKDMLIARVDMVSRSEDFCALLDAAPGWDLVIVDEAHKMSARMSGQDMKTTKRYDLGQKLSGRTRHFLLMTATPHNGKEEEFRAWMALLDPDRFAGTGKDNCNRKLDVSDLMRRMVKEELLRFDGTKLFPERRAYTVNYTLTPAEKELYEQVTEYVRNEMNRADQITNGAKRNSIGFALTMLQRRLASSPAAIHLSIKRRVDRLEKKAHDIEQRIEAENQEGCTLTRWERRFDNEDGEFDPEEDLSAEELEGSFCGDEIDSATAARSLSELRSEIQVLKGLELQASQILDSHEDTKWSQLKEVFRNSPEMRREDGSRRKIIIFTEHKDTLNYLANRIRDLEGNVGAVVTISGATSREDRNQAQEEFRNNPDVLVMVATDAAGEGVNLQNANLMVNYDMPWNPNRLEQRFGRIHRIGQTEMCHLWNMVASETREGDVFNTLLTKLERERQALGGRVFDILGEAMEDCRLRDLLIQAIRESDTPEARHWMDRVDSALEVALNTQHLKDVMSRNSLVKEAMDPEAMFRVREEMDRAEARKLQPCYIKDFTASALKFAGGEMDRIGRGRFSIPNVPQEVRNNPEIVSLTRDRISRKYENICFERPVNHGARRGPPSELIHAGHALVRSLIAYVDGRCRRFLKPGAVLVDPTDEGLEPSLLFMIDHSVRDSSGPDSVISQRLQFVRLRPDGSFSPAGWAPHLDLDAADSDQVRSIAQEVKLQPWLQGNLEEKALAYATGGICREHFEEVRDRRSAEIGRIRDAVDSRLKAEIGRLDGLSIEYKSRYGNTGRQIDLTNSQNRYAEARNLSMRRDARLAELAKQQEVVSDAPVVMGGILVIPQGLINQRSGEGEFSADAQERRRVEKLAMDAVMATEQLMGNIPIDVSADKCGWDVTSRRPRDGEVQPPDWHIEVKGRVRGADTVTVTKNEVLTAINQQDKFILAICLIDGEHVDGPYYVRRPFEHEMDFGVVSQNYSLAELLNRAEKMEVSATFIN